jgi:hypothetical protein
MSAPVRRVVGVVPWLPWPLSAWRWWTEPVRAERLAALRIGLATFLLYDLLTTYAPQVFTFFGSDSLGNPAVFGWRTHAPRLSWSLLCGPGDSLLSFLALTGWAVATAWIVADLGTRAIQGSGPRERDPLRHSLPVWLVCGTLAVLGVWSRLVDRPSELVYAWVPPLAMVSPAWLFLALEWLRAMRSADGVNVTALVLLGAALVGSVVLLGLGVHLASLTAVDPGSAWSRVLSNWQNDPDVLGGAMLVWVASTTLLLLGAWTRPAAVITWLLSISFANLNSSIDNAGDTIRNIILFYLMLCPCGAAWSLDRLWRRWRGKDAPALFVSPWPIRLLFLQLVFIYFCNGVYKLCGGAWRDGDSLYYVLGDITLTRLSPADIPLPDWALRLMTWAVLVWEVSFVALVLNRWTRMVALLFGVAFHLGIFASMELGCFVPYALCIYLPLLPWGEWRRREPPAVGPEPEDATVYVATPASEPWEATEEAPVAGELNVTPETAGGLAHPRRDP